MHIDQVHLFVSRLSSLFCSVQPLMQRVQAALQDQLTRQNEKLEIDLREKVHGVHVCVHAPPSFPIPPPSLFNLSFPCPSPFLSPFFYIVYTSLIPSYSLFFSPSIPLLSPPLSLARDSENSPRRAGETWSETLRGATAASQAADAAREGAG